MNTFKNTGIYQIINGENVAAEEKQIEGEAVYVDPFDGLVAPGWQKLLMMAIGLLIIYLGAGRGFEPLLLIPIGFGTVLVNIPGAGMYAEHSGMLRIIYDAVVGNYFFLILIFIVIVALTHFCPLSSYP